MSCTPARIRARAAQERKLERDLRLLQLELAERPEHPFTLFNLGMTHVHSGRFAEAADYLRAASPVEPRRVAPAQGVCACWSTPRCGWGGARRRWRSAGGAGPVPAGHRAAVSRGRAAPRAGAAGGGA